MNWLAVSSLSCYSILICLAALAVQIRTARANTDFFASSPRRASLYCPLDDNDPTIREIINAAIPWKDLSLDEISFDALLMEMIPEELQAPTQYIVNWKNQLLAVRPTFLLWLTLGRYRIHFDEKIFPSLSFNDIFIVQESHFRYNPICTVAMPKGIPFVSRVCHCEEKYRLENSDWSKSGTLLDRNQEDKSQWCVRKAPCTSRDLTSGLCEIYLDPARRSCLLIEHNKQSEIWEEMGSLLKFEMNIPKLKLLLPTGWVGRYTFDYEGKVKSFVAKVLDNIPFYFFNLVVGMFIMYFARDLAEDQFFQTIIQGIAGVFFGLFILMFVGHK